MKSNLNSALKKYGVKAYNRIATGKIASMHYPWLASLQGFCHKRLINILLEQWSDLRISKVTEKYIIFHNYRDLEDIYGFSFYEK